VRENIMNFPRHAVALIQARSFFARFAIVIS
jgi:hypothetical protein